MNIIGKLQTIEELISQGIIIKSYNPELDCIIQDLQETDVLGNGMRVSELKNNKVKSKYQ